MVVISDNGFLAFIDDSTVIRNFMLYRVVYTYTHIKMKIGASEAGA